MESKDKKTLSEADICDLFITPAIKNAGWDPMKQIRREVTLTPGPVVVRGNMSARNKKKIIRRLRPVLGAWRSNRRGRGQRQQSHRQSRHSALQSPRVSPYTRRRSTTPVSLTPLASQVSCRITPVSLSRPTPALGVRWPFLRRWLLLTSVPIGNRLPSGIHE